MNLKKHFKLRMQNSLENGRDVKLMNSSQNLKFASYASYFE